jgi:hypothetical protein
MMDAAAARERDVELSRQMGLSVVTAAKAADKLDYKR